VIRELGGQRLNFSKEPLPLEGVTTGIAEGEKEREGERRREGRDREGEGTKENVKQTQIKRRK
jgi:hypothetical protein